MSIVKLQGDVEKRSGIYYEYDADSTPLGEGGMGRVFKGFRVVERTGERTPIAIKAIYENIPERVVERARREAAIQLDHDNLIRMYGFVETITPIADGNKFRVHYHVIMELLVGVTLEDVLKGVVSDQNGMQIPFAAEVYSQYNQQRDVAVVKIMKSILSGLMTLHDRGYIHRDIDPSNIMITIDGKIKLIDFGICKQIVSLESLDKALTASGVFMGKVNYAAPEMVLGDVKSQSYTTDIYSLGILLYQLCAGHLPFSGTDQDILAANLRKKLPMKDIKDVRFKKIISKAADKVQSKRYATVAEMRVDLERLSGQKNRKGGYLWLAVIACIIVTIIGVLFMAENSATISKPSSVAMPTSDELYKEAKQLIARKDSIHMQQIGKEKLRVLAEDSLYLPAMNDYYVVMINSNVPDDVKIGFAELQKMAEDSSNNLAAFECGLTLSKSNSYFDVSAKRQAMLGIEADLEKANQWLRRVVNKDTTDYKSVYWMFNNLMESQIAGTLPHGEHQSLITYYKLFENRIENYDDPIAQKYKEAMAKDKVTLKAWGLLK